MAEDRTPQEQLYDLRQRADASQTVARGYAPMSWAYRNYMEQSDALDAQADAIEIPLRAADALREELLNEGYKPAPLAEYLAEAANALRAERGEG
jgi:hypothetical protein